MAPRLETPAAEDFLRAHTRTFLLTLRPDGAPTCHPMVGLWRDGALWLNTYRVAAPRIESFDFAKVRR